MKVFSAVVFSLFFLLTTMQETTFLLLYKLNEKAITERYCVNKQVKNSCCHGKCHLGKTMVNAEAQDNSNPFSVTSVKWKEVELFFGKISHQSLDTETLSVPIKYTLYSSDIAEGYVHTLLRPPSVLG